MKKRSLFIVALAGTLLLSGCGNTSNHSAGKTNSATESSVQESSSAESSVQEDSSAEQEESITESNGSATGTIFAMDTTMTMTAYGDHAKEAVTAAIKDIKRLDRMFSTNIASSDIAKVNANGGGRVSSETAYLIRRSIEFYKETDGVYDITVYPCVKAWGFTTGKYRIPSQKTIREKQKLVGTKWMHLDTKTNTVSFDKKGMMIDLGTVAKGYTSQKLAELFASYKVDGAVINLGGNVQVYGSKPDGTDWRVGLKNPEMNSSDSDMIGVITAKADAITTAGGYERYFEKNGTVYRHIFDPSTGCPTTSTLKSVTVVAKNGVDADGYDTALFIMGKKKAIEFWRQHKDTFDMILVDKNDTISVTEGIADRFTAKTGYKTETIQ